jgi:acetyl esterase
VILADYDLLLDDEVRAFLARTELHYPPDAVDLSVEDQRRVYNAMCADFDAGYPDSVTAQDRAFGGVSCRVYSCSEPVAGTVFFCHGGGFVVGGLDSHDSICAEFCASTGMQVVAVDYGLSPEHPFPQDFEDAWAAFEAVCAETEASIVLCGDSAGGNLVAAIAHYARGRIDGRLMGCLLIYPGLGGDRTRGSYVTHADAPGLSVRDLAFYQSLRSGGQDRTGDPRFAPLQDTDFSKLPPTVILTAQCDPLSSDGEAYRDAIQAAGGRAVWIEEAGLVHAHLRARHMSQRAATSFARMIQALTLLRAGQITDLD